MDELERLEAAPLAPQGDYRRTATLARAALDVCQGHSVVDTELFRPISILDESLNEGNTAPKMDALNSFTGSFYAQIYGGACTKALAGVKPGMDMGKAVRVLNETVANSYQKAVAPRRFEEVMFKGGLWKVFFDEQDLLAHDWAVEIGQSLDHGRPLSGETREVLETLRKVQYERLKDMPHATSHVDAVRLMNSYLNIGFGTLGLKTDDELLALLKTATGDLKYLALFNAPEMNSLSVAMLDPRNKAQFSQELFVVDSQAGTVQFDREAVPKRIDTSAKGIDHTRRGCPVLFLKTEYEGAQMPLFQVLGDTLVKIYAKTGALSRPSIRRLQ